MDKYILESFSDEETPLFYSAKTERDQETGCIGHFRMDYGKSGNDFWNSWTDHCAELNTQSFKDNFKDIIDTLRDGFLRNLSSMTSYCYNNPQAKLHGGNQNNYGFKVRTDNYIYYLRCFPLKSDYNLYIYAYEHEKLGKCLFEEHLKTAKALHLIKAYEKFHNLPNESRYSAYDDE